MIDKEGRQIDYLRISLTDRCNLSCIYCKPDNTAKLQHQDILTYEEILAICQCAVALGIKKFKITGGEPLVRKGCIGFLQQLKQLAGVEQVTLTTNGVLLAEYLPQLQAIQLDGINISLDTLDEEKYKQITGVDKLQTVIKNIRLAAESGLNIKLNCVPLQSMTAEDILALVNFAATYKLPLRFIELMPLACNQSLQGLTGARIKEILAEHQLYLTEDRTIYGNGPAKYYYIDKLQLPIGFIEPLHGKFCSSCNRVRLTSTGFLKACLYSNHGVDLKSLLRQQADTAKLTAALEAAIYEKPAAHHFESSPAGFQMNEIGG